MMMIGSAPSILALTGVVPDKLAANVSPANSCVAFVQLHWTISFLCCVQ